MTRDNNEQWVMLDRTSIRSHLCEQGFRDTKIEGESIAPLDVVINSIQLDKNVEAVVSGASGRHAGVYEENGHRVIVTKSPTLIKPRKGQFNTIKNFLQGLLVEEDQLNIFFAWLAHAAKNLRNEGKRIASWSPSQMLHIIGPPNAGKTLLLQDILTPCFAGRSASADPLFKKQPDLHNPDTFACELLFLDDSPVLESNYHFRQEFGERIKNHVVGIGGGMRDMHQGRLNIRPWWRFIRLMNMEPATLATLPPLDEGVEDKLILLKGEDMKKGPIGALMNVPHWYDEVKANIQSEIPAFLHYLLHEFETPEALKDPNNRFPVCSYKNPDVLLEVKQGSPESNLLHKFDSDGKESLFNQGTIFDDEDAGATNWEGTADELFDVLSACGSPTTQRRFSKMCPNPRILISQLRNLEKSNPDRVGYSKRLEGYPNKKKGCEYWVLFPKDSGPDEVEFEDLL